MKIEMHFDDIFLSLIKYIQPKRSGIYKKAFKDIKHELLICYQIVRKEAVNKEKQRKIEEDADLLNDIYENKQLKKYLKFCLDALIKHESDICNSDKFSECKDCVFRSISNSTQCKLKHYDEIIELLGEEYSDSDSAAVEEGKY